MLVTFGALFLLAVLPLPSLAQACDASNSKMQCAARNVLGLPLRKCGSETLATGYLRDGFCTRTPGDSGRHVVCAVVTSDFLAYSKSRGNDLVTPREIFSFPGLRPGDRWCLCAARWREAYQAGVAPGVYLQSTHESALEVVTLEMLQQHALDVPADGAAPASK